MERIFIEHDGCKYIKISVIENEFNKSIRNVGNGDDKYRQLVVAILNTILSNIKRKAGIWK